MIVRFLTLVALLTLLVACRDAPAPTADPAATAAVPEAEEAPAVEAQPQPPAVASATAVPPSPTPADPLAATVNGEPIYLFTFEETLARQEQGQALVVPTDLAAGDENRREVVLDLLIERALIEQAAAAQGIGVSEAMVDEKMAELRRVAADAGGDGSFEAWLQANQWTEEAFREALLFEMLAERVSAMVTADVPYAVPQVHARYIQVDDPELAEQIVDQTRNGADFADLAREHSLDRATGAEGGDLGYFPAGTLLVPELETAAFALQPGEVSDVITATAADGAPTYYVVQVLDIDPERPLNPELRARLLQQRFEAWLGEQWSQADIVRYIETDSG